MKKKLWDPCDRFESFLKIIDIPSISQPIPTCLFSFAIVQRQSKKGKKEKKGKVPPFTWTKIDFEDSPHCVRAGIQSSSGYGYCTHSNRTTLTNSGVTCEGSDEDFTAI